MDNTRETMTLQTPGQKELVIKTYLTGRERNDARNAVFSRFKFGVDGKQAEVKEMSADIITDGDNKLIEVAVQSYDGKTTGVLDAILNAPVEEYDFVLAEAKKVRGGDFLMAK